MLNRFKKNFSISHGSEATDLNIAMVTDANQIQGLINNIQSIIVSSSNLTRRRLSFHIVVDKDIESYQKILTHYFSRYRFQLISLEDKKYEELINKVNGLMKVYHDHTYTTNVMVFISLFLPDLLPSLDKFIYLDTDMIVQSDLGEIYDLSLEKFPLISPLILKAKYHQYSKCLDINPNAKNFNSGIYVLNCNYWRKNKFSDQCFEIMKKHHQQKLFRLASQPILNILFLNRVMDISSAWNVRIKNLSKYFLKVGKTVIYNKAKVLHWAGPSKGWDTDNSLHQYWKKYTPVKKKQIDVLMLATEHINEYTKYAIPMWKHYCDFHGYHFIRYDKSLLDDMPFTWSRIKMISDHLKSTDSEYVVMVDADILIYKEQHTLSIESLIDQYMNENHKILFQKDGSNRLGFYFSHNIKLSIINKRWTLPNAGFNIMKNSSEVLQFIDLWLELGRGKMNHLAQIHPMTQNVLLKGLLTNADLDKMVGYLPSSIVSKRNAKVFRHLSAMSKAKVAYKMEKEYQLYGDLLR